MKEVRSRKTNASFSLADVQRLTQQICLENREVVTSQLGR